VHGFRCYDNEREMPASARTRCVCRGYNKCIILRKHLNKRDWPLVKVSSGICLPYSSVSVTVQKLHNCIRQKIHGINHSIWRDAKSLYLVVDRYLTGDDFYRASTLIFVYNGTQNHNSVSQ